MRDLVGQWMGENKGTNPGELILELERYDQQYEGIAYLIEGDRDMPGTVAELSFPNSSASSLAKHFNILMRPRPFSKKNRTRIYKTGSSRDVWWRDIS